LALSVGEEPDTVEDVYEPFLLQAGLMMRTSRGRVPTSRTWVHLGLEEPAGILQPLPGFAASPVAGVSGAGGVGGVRHDDNNPLRVRGL
jgi:Holliday junction DNA helicase RuvB